LHSAAHPHWITSATINSTTYSYSHDDDGNLTKSYNAAYQFDSADHLTCAAAGTSCSGTNLRYDVDGTLLSETNGRLYLDDLVEWQGSAATLYVRAFGRRIAVKQISTASARGSWAPAAWPLPIGPVPVALSLVVVALPFLLLGLRRAGVLVAVAERPLPAAVSILVCATLLPAPVAWSGGVPTSSTERYWLFPDHQGTAVFVANSTASIWRRKIYEPFGKLVAETNQPSGTNPKSFFTDKGLSSATGLYDCSSSTRSSTTATCRFDSLCV
jgi:hypothetical protein